MFKHIDSIRGDNSPLKNIDGLTQLHPSLWRAHQLGQSKVPQVSSGYPALNAQLPAGGWPSGNLIELLHKHAGIGELRFLVPCLRTLAMEGKQVVLLSPPYLPVPAVFEQLGIPSKQVMVIDTPKPQDKLWAMEQLLQSDAFGAMVMWLPERIGNPHGKTVATDSRVKLLEASVLRRLQVHAAKAQGLCFAFRPLEAQQQPSPAPLRLTLTAHSPGQLRVHLIKRRGPTIEVPLVLQLPGAPSDWCQNPLATGLLWQMNGLLTGEDVVQPIWTSEPSKVNSNHSPEVWNDPAQVTRIGNPTHGQELNNAMDFSGLYTPAATQRSSLTRPSGHSEHW